MIDLTAKSENNDGLIGEVLAKRCPRGCYSRGSTSPTKNNAASLSPTDDNKAQLPFDITTTSQNNISPSIHQSPLFNLLSSRQLVSIPCHPSETCWPHFDWRQQVMRWKQLYLCIPMLSYVWTKR